MAVVLAVIGGGAIVVGSFLPWVDAGGGVSVGTVSVTGAPKGSELLVGQVALGAGIAVVLLGLLLLAIGRARRLFGLLLVLGGIVAIATAVYVASSPQVRYVDFAAKTAAPTDRVKEVRASLTNLFSASSLKADPGVGLYAAIGGGVAPAIAGASLLFGRRRLRVEAAESEAPAEGPREFDEMSAGPDREQPASPVHESPEPASDVAEEPQAERDESAAVGGMASSDESSLEAVSRNRDKWSFPMRDGDLKK